MHIFLKNSPAKFHPDPIWNDGALGVFEEVGSNKKKNKDNKMSSDMRSVPDHSFYRHRRTRLKCRCYPLM